MDPEHGQPGMVPLPAGFDLHQMMGASTPGFENPAAGTVPPGGMPDGGGSLGGLPISEMPRGDMVSAETAWGSKGGTPGELAGGMPSGAMAGEFGETQAGTEPGDSLGGMDTGLAPGHHPVGRAAHSPPGDQRDGMPTGAMTTAGQPGAAFESAADVPDSGGMPAGAMIGDSGALAEPSPPSSTGGRAGEVALEGRWRLTLSSITS